MIIQFYAGEGNARIFTDNSDWVMDLTNIENKEDINNFFKKLKIKLNKWKEADWGWYCKIRIEE